MTLTLATAVTMLLLGQDGGPRRGPGVQARFDCAWGLEAPATAAITFDGERFTLPVGTVRFSTHLKQALFVHWRQQLFVDKVSDMDVRVYVRGGVARDRDDDERLSVAKRVGVTWGPKTLVLKRPWVEDGALEPTPGVSEFTVVHENLRYLLTARYQAKAPLTLNLDDPADLEKKGVAYSLLRKDEERLATFVPGEERVEKTKQGCGAPAVPAE